jgi:hypothetical protein
MKKLHYFCFGYTLIELLIAVSLSLLLLLGVTEMFRHVGSTMSDTQKSLNMSANLNATAMTLRSDLEKLDPALAHQPYNMTQSGYAGDTPGYLEITEGMNAPYSVTTATGLHVPINQVAANLDTVGVLAIDQTVGDVDDILAFTVTASAEYKFRGLINGSMNESQQAEIIWFVRGTTLYRRVFLYDEYPAADRKTLDQNQQSFYANNDLAGYVDSGDVKTHVMEDLVYRENRFAHTITTFPYPLYDSTNEAWYFLRMPTLEEMVHPTWVLGQQLPPLGSLAVLEMNGIRIFPDPPTTTPYWDFWNNPNGLIGSNWQLDSKSGSLTNYVQTTRHSRAGEDIVLKNVISFDVKVWNPYWVPCSEISPDPDPDPDPNPTTYWAPPQYVDLGQDYLPCIDGIIRPVNYGHDLSSSPEPAGYGFTLKGRYNTATKNRRTVTTDTEEEWHRAERLHNGTSANQLWSTASPNSPMPCVFDSWTNKYENEGNTILGDNSDYRLAEPWTWRCPPPYTEDLRSIQITIRCFEPQSGHIKQIRVVQSF